MILFRNAEHVGGDTMTDRKNIAAIICCAVITLAAIAGVNSFLRYCIKNTYVIVQSQSSSQHYPNPEVVGELYTDENGEVAFRPAEGSRTETYYEPWQQTKNSGSARRQLGYDSAELILSVADIALVGAGIFGYVIYRQLRERYARDMVKMFALYGIYFVVSAAAVFGVYTYCRNKDPNSAKESKCFLFNAPVIYLYDDQSRDVSVKLIMDGDLTCTYPTYQPDTGWTVKASPDGTLTDSNGRQYEYLFWEASAPLPIDLSKGFCVKGEDTAAFLEKALSDLGLSDTEANTFIMYWLPKLENNPYNVISFQTTNYQEAFVLDVSPVPDTVIRVNMAFYGTDKYVEMEPQDLASMNPSLEERKGLTVVEWGGEDIS